jgi:hypothetical protein
VHCVELQVAVCDSARVLNFGICSKEFSVILFLVSK